METQAVLYSVPNLWAAGYRLWRFPPQYKVVVEVADRGKKKSIYHSCIVVVSLPSLIFSYDSSEGFDPPPGEPEH